MRLKSQLWVQAYLRLCQINDAAAYVVRRGQEDGGSIFVKISRLNGTIDLYIPAPAGFGEGNERYWSLDPKLTAINEADAATYLARQCDFDSDIWIIEVEDRQGRHFLNDAIVDH